MVTTEIVKYQTFSGEEIALTAADVKSLCKHANDEEIHRFLKLCLYQKLNPFLNDAFLIKYDAKATATMVVAKSVFDERADDHPEFEGLTSGVVVQRGNEIIERDGGLCLPGDKLLGAWAIVHRRGRVPRVVKVDIKEYHKGQSSWNVMPSTMIVKVAEHQALRKSFPSTFKGLYSQEEMSRAIEDNHEGVTIEGEGRVIDTVPGNPAPTTQTTERPQDAPEGPSAPQRGGNSIGACPLHSVDIIAGKYGPYHKLDGKSVSIDKCYTAYLGWDKEEMREWVQERSGTTWYAATPLQKEALYEQLLEVVPAPDVIGGDEEELTE